MQANLLWAYASLGHWSRIDADLLEAVVLRMLRMYRVSSQPGLVPPAGPHPQQQMWQQLAELPYTHSCPYLQRQASPNGLPYRPASNAPRAGLPSGQGSSMLLQQPGHASWLARTLPCEVEQRICTACWACSPLACWVAHAGSLLHRCCCLLHWDRPALAAVLRHDGMHFSHCQASLHAAASHRAGTQCGRPCQCGLVHSQDGPRQPPDAPPTGGRRR